MADVLFQLLHGLGAGEFTGVYGRARAAAHWVYRVHVARLADGLVLPHAPALVLSFLTVVFCVFFTCPAAAARRRRFAKRVFHAAEARSAPRSTQ